MPFIHQKHFTVAEAQRCVQEIRPLARRMVELKGLLDLRRYDIYRHQYFGGSGPNGDRFFPPELEELVILLKKIDAMGILVKGIEEGLIDFPHVRATGEEVYLCYKANEPKIEYWHTIEEGFTGRRPLNLL